jgi:peptidoglycan/LPS O-acetylase OafA/YrhL
MIEKDALLHRLGGQPGRYAVATVVLTLLWFPFRLLLDRGDPIAEIIATSGMNGAIWALIPVTIEWGQRRRSSPENRPAQDSPEEARRGVVVGLAVGTPFAAAFLILCLSTSLSPGYAVFFSLLLLAIVAVALRNHRRHGRMSR